MAERQCPVCGTRQKINIIDHIPTLKGIKTRYRCPLGHTFYLKDSLTKVIPAKHRMTKEEKSGEKRLRERGY